MLSGLLITLNILVCIALIGVVLLQRSEGGAFGMGGGPTGLITARGAGDLLTRTTWILFALFLALSLGLTLLGAHDRATSSVIEKLKLQQANTNALNAQPAAPAPTAPLTGNAPTTSPFLAPPPVSAAPVAAPAPVAVTPTAAPTPAKPTTGHAAAPRPAPSAAPAAAQAPPPPPVLLAPAPAAAPSPAAPTTGSPAPAGNP
jgi:preprotein translocase subunit SecG